MNSRISIPEYPPAMILIVDDSGRLTMFSSDYGEAEGLRAALNDTHGPPDWETEGNTVEREKLLDAVRGMSIARVLAQSRRFANPSTTGKRQGLADGTD